MQEVGVEANYINGTDSPETQIYMAARQCYWTDKPGNSLISDVLHATQGEKERLIKACVKAGHQSVLEHAVFSWQIKCSRACSHQLVRHRLASYSQQSQRYCTFDNIQVITPDTIKKHWLAHFVFRSLIKAIELSYRLFIVLEIPGEDARSILPNCTRTEVVTTMNFRELLHFFSERCCSKAQSEIRTIANSMLGDCKILTPSVFANAGPKCIESKRCPENKPCGKTPWKM